ncbi:MAG: hypothetical protein ACKPKO_46400, partial [Candidatus Fonsibacter sp.]
MSLYKFCLATITVFIPCHQYYYSYYYQYNPNHYSSTHNTLLQHQIYSCFIITIIIIIELFGYMLTSTCLQRFLLPDPSVEFLIMATLT